MSNRSTSLWLLGIALVAWSGFLLFTYFVNPEPPSVFVLTVFFLILGIAMTSTFALIAHGIGARLLASRIYQATMRHAIRQGALLALVIILNLILQVFHSWSFVSLLLICGAAVVLEVLSLARK